MIEGLDYNDWMDYKELLTVANDEQVLTMAKEAVRELRKRLTTSGREYSDFNPTANKASDPLPEDYFRRQGRGYGEWNKW
jgi:hypothetical protein